MKLKSFNEFKKIQREQKVIGYHITRESLLPTIIENGLEPRIPEDFGDNGDLKGVYLFKTVDDFDTALGSWFGERIEDWEEDNDDEFKESLIVVDLSGLDLCDSVEYEWTCLEHISPDRFIEIFDYDKFDTSIYNHLRSTYE